MSSEVAVQVHCCFTSTETISTIWDGGNPGRPPPRSQRPSALSGTGGTQDVHLHVHRDHQHYLGRGEPRTSTSTFTETISTIWDGGNPGRPPPLSQRPSALSGTGGTQDVHLHVHRDHQHYLGRGEPRTSTSTFTETISTIWDGGNPGHPPPLSQRPSALSGTGGTQDVHLHVHRDHQHYLGRGEPRTSTSTFTETISTIWDGGNPGHPPPLSQRPSALSGTGGTQDVHLHFHRDHQHYLGRGEPRTSTSTFTQLLTTLMLLFKLKFECCFTSTENYGGRGGGGAMDVHLDFHTAPESSELLGFLSRP